jgi:Fe-S oxidoreductase
MAQPIGIPEDIRRTAAQCRHYSMCKIDYLDTGLCPPATARPYVGYFPQGRMDICKALAGGLLPVTERLVDIVSSCTLCGRCDKQCHFATGMRPMKVMEALKNWLDAG